MSYFAQSLQSHYQKHGRRIIFTNGMSLNQLALKMWELLDYQEMDVSVLSRVINGERLFTPTQLKVFSKILKLNKDDRKYLFYCLVKDYNLKKNLNIDNFLIPTQTAYEVIKILTASAFRTLFAGDFRAVENHCNLVEIFIDAFKYKFRHYPKDRIESLIGLNLYLKGRTIESLSSPKTVIKEIITVYRKLLNIAQDLHNKTFYAYAHVLLTNAYYVAGEYSYLESKLKFYRAAIHYGKIAISNLSDDDSEKLLALRNMVASAIYLKDKETIMHIFKTTKKIIPSQPIDNRVNALHLCGSLSKGLAVFKISNPFSIKKYAHSYFQDDLTNMGMYEVSDIKTEVETLLSIRTRDKNYIVSRIKKGIDIADHYHIYRHKKYLVNILKNL